MLVLMGKTCSGKDTICNGLIKDYGFKRVITYTTRPIGGRDICNYTSNIEYAKNFEKDKY